MTDAVLGVRVETSGAEEGVIALDKLTGSSQRAEGAARRLAKAEVESTKVALAKARAADADARATLAKVRASAAATTEEIKAARAAQMNATAELAAARASVQNAQAKVAVAGAAMRESTSINRSTVAANDNARAMMRNGAAARAAGASMNTGGIGVANLAAQFQDVSVSAAMGMNPLQIALQQGTQISAVLGPMGAAGALKSLGAAFASVISPVSLVVIGAVALVAAGLQVVDWAFVASSAMTGLASVLETIAPYATAAAAALALMYAPAVITGLVSVIALLSSMATAALAAAAALVLANPAGAFILGVTAAVAAMNIFRDEITKAFGFDLVEAVKQWGNWLIDVVGTAFNTAVQYAESGVNQIIALMNKIPGVGVGAVDFSGAQFETGGDHIGAFGGAIAAGASAAAEKLRELAAGFASVSEESDKASKKTEDQFTDLTDALITPWQRYENQLARIDLAHKKTAISAQGAARLQVMAGADLANSYVNVAGQITGALSSAFQENKGFAIANAVVNTAAGITKAFADPKLLFPADFAVAASIAAAGAAQIATIASASPGSGRKPNVRGGGVAMGGGGGSSQRASSPEDDARRQGGAGEQAAPTAQSRSVHIVLEGRGYSREEVLDLIEEMDKAFGDGATAPHITASAA